MATEERTNPDIPDDAFENPFADGTFLNGIFGKVVRQNRDIVMIVSDLRGRRGTGKSTLSIQLADMMDQTPEGITYDKCTISAENFINSYAEHPKKSGLVLDEAQVSAGNRTPMAKVNRAIRKMMSMARVREKYVIINVPLKHFVDSDILKLADVWIGMQQRGKGLVHHLKWEPYSETLHTEKKQTIEIDDIESDGNLHEVYQRLTREKNKRISDGEDTKFLPKSEVDKQLKQAREDARKETRNELLQDIYRTFDLTQRELGEAVGLSQQRVGEIVRE